MRVLCHAELTAESRVCASKAAAQYHLATAQGGCTGSARRKVRSKAAASCVPKALRPLCGQRGASHAGNVSLPARVLELLRKL